VVVLLIAACAWISVLVSAAGGPDMMMTMPMPATLADGLAFVGSWAIMMAAMMLPSALPMITLYGAIQRREAPAAAGGVPVAVFVLVYLLLWTATGVPVYLAHTALMGLGAPAFSYAVAVILLAGGLFQLSPLKQVCLRVCRSPLGFLLSHWRAGLWGSLALG